MKKLFLFALFAVGLILTSCYQAPQNGVAKITVVDANDFRIPSAGVTLKGPVGSYINETGICDLNGVWNYEHDPALDVILQVEATHPVTGNTADGIVRITPDKTEEVTIKIY
jgi:hypothetical protein